MGSVNTNTFISSKNHCKTTIYNIILIFQSKIISRSVPFSTPTCCECSEWQRKIQPGITNVFPAVVRYTGPLQRSNPWALVFISLPGLTSVEWP